MDSGSGNRWRGIHSSPDPLVEFAVVGNALHDLWKSDQIEGVLTLGGVKPYLNGIVRVVPGRDRLWGRDRRYKTQP
jgi:hypothetical protein